MIYKRGEVCWHKFTGQGKLIRESTRLYGDPRTSALRACVGGDRLGRWSG